MVAVDHLIHIFFNVALRDVSVVAYETKRNQRCPKGFWLIAGGIELSGTKNYKSEGRISLWDDESLSFKHMLNVRCI